MKKYRFIEAITSDIVFEAYGGNLEELFRNAAEALFSVICKIKKVKSVKRKLVEVRGDNLEKLMINWLQELIAIVDIDELFLSKFKILSISKKKLKAECYGEEIKPELGETVVKAVTYHQYKFERTKEGYKIRVSLDI
jgi:SHS2 domain-containing protein